jgi:hypothetical protein
MSFAPPEPRRAADWPFLTILLLAAILLKCWLISRSPLFARDGVGFIELAQCLNEEPWDAVLRKAHQHPLYPMNIWATARIYRCCVPGPLENADWLLCAHLANAWASVLACIPMYFLGKRLGGPWVGFGGTLLFITLPVPASVLADTLSEGAYLLCLVTGLWALTIGLEKRRLFWFATAGLCGGLAFLARPEGAMLPVVAVPLIIACKWRNWWPASWPRTLVIAATLSAFTLAVTIPYWATIGGLGKKTTFKEMLNVEHSPTVDSRLLLASRFQPGVDGYNWDNITAVFIARTILTETAKCFGYVALVPALVGIWLLWRRGQLGGQPVGWVLLAIGLLNWLLLAWLAWKARYVSERHTILIVLIGCWMAMPALSAFAAWLAARWPALAGRARSIAPAALIVLVLGALPQSLRPQHLQRLAHRDAGFWLKSQLRPEDRIVDPYGYAAFFAERRVVFRKPGALPAMAEGNVYLVLEPDENDRDRLKRAGRVKERGQIVKQWPSGPKPRVVVYRSRSNPALTAGK